MIRVEEIRRNGLYPLDMSINIWIKYNSARFDVVNIRFDGDRAYIIYKDKEVIK